MDTAAVLTQIKASGLTLRPSGARLVVDSNKPLTEQWRQFIRQHKTSILKALAATPSQPTATAGARPVAPATAVTEPLPTRNLPKSKDTPAKVTKVAKLEPGDGENFSDFSGFSGSHLAFARNPEKRSDPKPDRHDRRCYLCVSFTPSPYGFPLGLCQQHGDRIQHSTSPPALGVIPSC